MNKAFFIFFLANFLIGCVTHEEKPISWAKPIQSCNSINGYFNPIGVSASGSFSPNLGNLLLGIPAQTDEQVKINTERTELSISLLADGQVIALRKAKLDCDNGVFGIEVANPEGLINREGVIGYENESILIEFLSDGSLAVQKKSLGFGMLLLIPYIGSASYWYRFDKET